MLLALIAGLAGCALLRRANVEEGFAGVETGSQETEQQGHVCISEIMSSNESILADRAGNFGDWIELCNDGNERVELGGYQLRCGKDRWIFPDCVLEPGAFRIVFCDREDRIDGEEMHSNFAISASGERLRLFTPTGGLADTFPAVELEEDTSAARDPETGKLHISRWSTPGYENSEAGFEAFQREQTMARHDLVINEAIVFNDRFAPLGGEYYDLIELYNPTDQVLDLGQYFLSDQESDRYKARLPGAGLAPGSLALLYCSADIGNEQCLHIALNAQKEELYLSRADGSLCDYVCLKDIPLGYSYGRVGDEGWFYLENPTPGAVNRGGVRFSDEMPELIGEDGVYNGVESVTVELRGPGIIRYTTDGSEPDAYSAEYTGPLTITSTGVIRAASFRENHTRSEVLSLSYILNEEHALPVVSLVCDGEKMFGERGVYYTPHEEIEIPAAVMLYGEDGSLRTDCGVKLHGATSKFVQEKKSLKLSFRDRYGGALHSDLFGNGVTEFDSVLLRTAQEGDSSSYMRDALMHEVAKECFPALPAQDHRYVVLYINGRYWGLYNLREAHSAEHYANHYGTLPETVKQWQGKWPADSMAEEIYRFAITHDLSKQENYEFVAGHVNIDSVVAWLILQDYSGNIDFNSPNMRFYWSEEDQQLRYGLSDLDLGLFTEGNLPSLTTRGYYAYNRLAGALWKNADFRKAFCLQLNDALHGPLSDEAMLERIDRFADGIRPEIAREKTRWGGKPADWEHLVGDIRGFITKKDGQANNIVRLLVANGALKTSEATEYLPDFVKKRR